MTPFSCAVASTSTGPNRIPQILTLDVLEHQEVAVLSLDVVVDLADVWVVELGQGPRFAEKACLCSGFEARILADRLDSYRAAQGLIKAEVHLAHATGTDEFGDPNMADGGTDAALPVHRSPLM